MSVSRTLEKKSALLRSGIALACVLPTIALAATTDVDNAALLYYQAMIQCPDWHEFPDEVFSDTFGFKGDPERAKVLVKSHSGVIDNIEKAVQIRRCDWGLRPLAASKTWPSVGSCSRTIVFLVAAKTRLLAQEGEYVAAFEELLMLRQFAAHMASDPNMYLIAPTMVEGITVRWLHYLMNITPPDRELLMWLREQLVFEPWDDQWFPEILRSEFQETLLRLRTDETALPKLRTIVPTKSPAAYRAAQEAWSELDDDELYELIRQSYATFLESVLDVLADDLPYGQTCEALDALTQRLEQRAMDDPAVIASWLDYGGDMTNRYGYLVLLEANLDRLRVAVEIHLERIKTGQLPETLPDGVPKDPFTGQDFEYERTPTGFLLRCGSAAPDQTQPIREFEFTVLESEPD